MGAQAFSVAPASVDDDHGHSFVDHRGLFVLHAILLNTGKVLCFSGCVERQMYAPFCYLFDPDHPTATLSPISFPPKADMFCCHYVQAPDGRILAIGGSQHDVEDPPGSGTIKYRGSNGSKTIALFDPSTEQWTVSTTNGVANELKQGRWYPTAVTMPDGRVAVFSGRRELDDHAAQLPGVPPANIADMVEILGPPDWDSKELANAGRSLPIYPGLHLAPNGRIYFTHTNWGQQIADPSTKSILIPDGATSVTGWDDYVGAISNMQNPRREEGMSVLLPPAQDGLILVIGGSKALNGAGVGVLEPGGGGTGAFDHIEKADDPIKADILDTNQDPPTWSDAGPMNFGRINGHCILLPDATVFICGGHNSYKWRSRAAGTTPSQTAEIYVPGSPAGTFKTVAVGERNDPGRQMQDPRMYHSVALLLPDGRVFTAGGADPNREEPPPVGAAWVPTPGVVPPAVDQYDANYPAGWVGRRYTPGFALNVKTYEFYEPPYMFNPDNAARPKIDDVQRDGATSRRIEYGKTFTIKTAQAASITAVAFIRPQACTHHTDSEQRYVRLEFTKGSGELTVTAVDNAKIAPPGYYMLWIVDDQKRPCQRAEFIRLVPKDSSW